jgi:glycosyltransferase involved in cell wall biosynthesis
MLSIVFSYNREKHLRACVKELQEFSEVMVFDDCSSFQLSGFKYHKNKVNLGKRGFVDQWQKAWEYCKNSKHDLFLFSPDDFIGFDIERIKEMVSIIDSPYYFINYVRDNRDECWVKFKPENIHPTYRQIGFVDCAVIVNRATLEKLKWVVPTVPDYWHRLKLSSGVGKFMSHELQRLKIPIYQPFKSFAQHNGNDCSVMHPFERIKRPIFAI